MEPMLLGDHKYGQVPQIISNLMDYFKQHNLNPDRNDIIIAFTYLLMIECGFVHKGYQEEVTDSDFNYQRLLQHSKQLPQNWKSSNTYQMEFMLASVPGVICKIIGIHVSDDLLINCTIPQRGCFSLLVDPLTYFTSSQVQLNSYNFQNLDRLSLKFKDTVVFPVKLTMVRIVDGIFPCLQHLPYELFSYIMTFLNMSEVLDLAKTSPCMCATLKDNALWIKILQAYYRRKNIRKPYTKLQSEYEIKFSSALDKIMNHGFHW